MNQLFKGNFRLAVLAVAIFFLITVIASPAYSRSRRHHFPQPCFRSHHFRVHHDVDILPALIATGIIAGVTYSLIDNAANPPAPEYRFATPTYAPVVAPCPRVSEISSGSVMVTAQLLNFRTGPSLDAPSIRQIPYGTMLSVRGGSSGWYYVNLDGEYGWVMIRYTEPVGHSGAG